MTAISTMGLGLAMCGVLIAAGCSGKDNAASAPQEPAVSVSCIGVLPVNPAVDTDETLSQAEIRNLKDGSQVMNGVLKEVLSSKAKIQFITSQQLSAVTSQDGLANLEDARRLASQTSCNVLMQTNLSRYEDRVGSEYGVKEPAAVTFDYKLYEVGQGKVLCHGRFDEKQQSVMENLLTFNKASNRGFSWITAQELLREGLKDRLGQCSYFVNK